MKLGVNDFSISLDSCCAAEMGRIAGASTSEVSQLVHNIRVLSKITYVTVGIVLTDENLPRLAETVQFAHDLGVADIRIIPAAQHGRMIAGVEKIPKHVADAHPILRYRVNNLLSGSSSSRRKTRSPSTPSALNTSAT